MKEPAVKKVDKLVKGTVAVTGAIGGAGIGALSGAALGSAVFPGVGTVIGAGAGAVILGAGGGFTGQMIGKATVGCRKIITKVGRKAKILPGKKTRRYQKAKTRSRIIDYSHQTIRLAPEYETLSISDPTHALPLLQHEYYTEEPLGLSPPEETNVDPSTVELSSTVKSSDSKDLITF